jgi:hypothetical protein
MIHAKIVLFLGISRYKFYGQPFNKIDKNLIKKIVACKASAIVFLLEI